VLYGTYTVDIQAAKQTEDRMYESMVNSREIQPNPEKRTAAAEAGAQRGGPEAAVLARGSSD